MNLDKLRTHCLAFPGATEQIQWGSDLVFKVGGRMFAVAATDHAAAHRLSFKCTDEGLQSCSNTTASFRRRTLRARTGSHSSASTH